MNKKHIVVVAILLTTTYSAKAQWMRVLYDEFTGPALDDKVWRPRWPWNTNADYDDKKGADAVGQDCWTPDNISFDGDHVISTTQNNLVYPRVVDYLPDDAHLVDYPYNLKLNKRMFYRSTGVFSSLRRFHYGYYEIRFKTPDVKWGYCSAFWLYGDNKEEIDAFEMGNEWATKHTDLFTWTREMRGYDYHYNIHYDGKNGGGGPGDWASYKPTDWHSDWHVIGVLWTKGNGSDRVEWWVDGNEGPHLDYPFKGGMNLMADLGFGGKNAGTLGGNFDGTETGGSYNVRNHPSDFPASMKIDYIKAWHYVDCSLVYTQSSVTDDDNIFSGKDITFDPGSGSTIEVGSSHYLDAYATEHITFKPGFKSLYGSHTIAEIIPCPTQVPYKKGQAGGPPNYPEETSKITTKPAPQASEIASIDSSISLDVFPSPNDGVFEVRLRGNNNSYITGMHVLNVQGVEVNGLSNIKVKDMPMNIRKLAPGVYFLRIMVGNTPYFRKVVYN